MIGGIYPICFESIRSEQHHRLPEFQRENRRERVRIRQLDTGIIKFLDVSIKVAVLNGFVRPDAMDFDSIDQSGLLIATQEMAGNSSINNSVKQIEKEFTPVLIHLSGKFSDWAWKIHRLFRTIDKGRHFKDCVPKFRDIRVLLNHRH